MKKRLVVAITVATAAVLLVAALAAVGLGATDPYPNSTPIGPEMEPDTGAGELLVVVVGGVYAARAGAESADDSMPFGDLAGYYVVPVAQFQGFREQVGDAGDYALVSAFRTEAGAEGFAALAQSLGYPARILPDRVRSLGGLYAGLGQEAAPDGSGPLTGPIPASLP